MKINIFLGDSQQAMQSMKDNQYGLGIIDTPYGIGEDGGSNESRCKKTNFGAKNTKNTIVKAKNYKPFHGNDLAPPDKSYFIDLKRVAENQIIWGANHFLGWSSSCWIVWDKVNGACDFADCELAYTSFNTAVRKFTFRWAGMLQGDMKNKQIRLHPTEKPIALYKWLLKNYGFNKDGSKRTIFDSHGGSMSIVIACIDMGFDIDIWELDEDYYNDAVKRIKRHLQQLDLTREPVEINYIQQRKD